MRHGFTLFRQLRPQLPARIRLTIQRLRDRGRASHLAKTRNLHLKVAAVVLVLKQVAGAYLTRSLGLVPVGLNPSGTAGARSNSPRSVSTNNSSPAKIRLPDCNPL